MSAGIIDRFIETRNSATDDEKKIADDAKKIRAERYEEKEKLIKHMEDNNIRFLEIPPPEDDPSGKPSYIRLEKTIKPGGSLSLTSVEAAFFGPKEGDEKDTNNAAMNILVGGFESAWREKLRAATMSLAQKRAEEKIKQEKKLEEKSKKLKKRRRIVETIMKMKEEEDALNKPMNELSNETINESVNEISNEPSNEHGNELCDKADGSNNEQVNEKRARKRSRK